MSKSTKARQSEAKEAGKGGPRQNAGGPEHRGPDAREEPEPVIGELAKYGKRAPLIAGNDLTAQG
jgi:hypothetical protein